MNLCPINDINHKTVHITLVVYLPGLRHQENFTSAPVWTGCKIPKTIFRDYGKWKVAVTSCTTLVGDISQSVSNSLQD